MSQEHHSPSTETDGAAATSATPPEPDQADATPGALADAYSPFRGPERAPMPVEISAWHEAFLTDARADVASGKATNPAHYHHAEVAADAIGSAWLKLHERIQREGLSVYQGWKLAGRAMVAIMSQEPGFDIEREPAGPVDEDSEAPALDTVEVAREATAAQDEAGEMEVTPDIVEVAVRYEQMRVARAAATAQGRKFGDELAGLERELLSAFVDSGQKNISIIMPGSGENRVLTPSPKAWPKVRPDEEAPADENGEHPLIDEARRIAAIKAAGLDHLVVEKIDTKALNAYFEDKATDADLPEELREVYTIATEWKIGSTKGATGRRRTPTAAEVADGRAPRARG